MDSMSILFCMKNDYDDSGGYDCGDGSGDGSGDDGKLKALMNDEQVFVIRVRT
jgi:hypothetical protein